MTHEESYNKAKQWHILKLSKASKIVEDAYKEAKQWREAVGVAPPHVEEVIATDAKYSYWYARDICGRFELGEPAIATDQYYLQFYHGFLLENGIE